MQIKVLFFLLTQRFVPLQPRSSLTDTAVFGQDTSYKLQVTNETEAKTNKDVKLYYIIIIYNIIIYNKIIYLTNSCFCQTCTTCTPNVTCDL